MALVNLVFHVLLIKLVEEHDKEVPPGRSRTFDIFNLRDLSNIFLDELFAQKDFLKEHVEQVIDVVDNQALSVMQRELAKKNFEDQEQNVILAEPLIYTHFACRIAGPSTAAPKDWPSLKKLLEGALDQYNEMSAAMDLVLFDGAIFHISRISRILESPRGNALPVGDAGSSELKAKIEEAERLIEFFGIDTEKVNKEKSIADAEERKVAEFTKKVE
ncbi:Dynein heavy chain 9, axonemal [Blastocladiella emersonii ATCC 22665]|nr:Dynein heavy chain 9, axonemal [Blastocladiella emersonii ATCC 22665]